MEPQRDTLRRDGPADPLPLTFSVHFLLRLFVEDLTARTGRVRASVSSPDLKE